MLLASLQKTVVRIGPAVCAGQSLEARVLGQSQGEAVLGAEFLELGHDAVGDAGDALGEEAVHHRLVDLELVLDREVDEVGVDEDVVGRAELCVVLEEHGRGNLRDLLGRRLLGLLLGLHCNYLLLLVCFATNTNTKIRRKK